MTFQTNRLAAAIAFGCLLAATPASAQQSWTGLFVGVGGGYGSANTEITGRPGPAAILAGVPANVAIGFDGLGLDGAMLSLAAGADYQFNSKFVAGVFFDYDFQRLSAGASANGGGAFGINAASATAEVDSTLAIGARLGYLISPTTLWYVTAGYTRADADKLAGSANVGMGTFSGSLDLPSFSGYFIGGGVESQMMSNLSVKLEYRYSDYGKEQLDLSPIHPLANDYVIVEMEPTAQMVRASINYRFGK